MLFTFTREVSSCPSLPKLDELGKPAWIALMILASWSGGRWAWRSSPSLSGADAWVAGYEAVRPLAAQDGAHAEQDGPDARAHGGHGSAAGRRAVERQPRLRRVSHRDAARLEDEQREFHDSSTGCAWPRTSPSSTSSWPSGAIAQPELLSRRAEFISSCQRPDRLQRSRPPRDCEAGGFRMRAGCMVRATLRRR